MRRYTIRCDGFPETILEGSFSFSAFDAGLKWLSEKEPEYEPCSAIYLKTNEDEENGPHTIWRMEAYGHDADKGIVIYIRELL